MHHRFMRHVAVGKDHLIDGKLVDQLNQIAFRKNRDALGVKRPGQRGRVGAVFNIWDLSRSEGDHLAIAVITEDDIEVVEIAACRPHDENLRFH